MRFPGFISFHPYSLLHGLFAQSCLTLCDPMDCSLPGSSVHGILQARILEWVAVSFSKSPPNCTHFTGEETDPKVSPQRFGSTSPWRGEGTVSVGTEVIALLERCEGQSCACGGGGAVDERTGRFH